LTSVVSRRVLVMWKSSLLLFVAGLGSISAQEIVLSCTFQTTGITLYGCYLDHIEVLDPSITVTFTGDHLADRSDSDVNYVRIRDSDTPFMIQQIFTTFNNIVRLEIYNSNLQSISIPASVQLNWLALGANNISSIESGSINNQTQLGYFNLANNNIEHIDENAFEGLINVDSFVMNNNRIREIAPRTFHPLSFVMSLDLANNLLTRINEETFSTNSNLLYIYLEHNQITEIHPRSFDSIRESLRSVNLLDNHCVDNSFSLLDENSWETMIQALQTCFSNFTPGRRRLIIEFEGLLSLFDSDGNLIITV